MLSRRTVLRGLGAAVSLPMLEAMLPLRAFGAVGKSPVRMAFLFTPNGMSMPQWTPAQAGTLGDLPPVLQSLSSVRDSINILTGLTQYNANALADGPGDHARSAATWLTGVHPHKTAGADIQGGVSVDQVAAMRLGDATQFPSLELGCERGAAAGDCDSGYSCAYSSSIAWQTPSMPLPHETNPRLVFERLFGVADPGETAQSRAMRERNNLSILDFVSDQAKGLRGQLGNRDRLKLDEYMTGVREIEKRLNRTESAVNHIVPSQIPSDAPSDFGEHIRLMGDMMVLAFQADLTRVSTLMIANEGSNRAYNEIGVPDGHHEMSHHGTDPERLRKKLAIDTFHVQQVAYILEKMKSIQEPGGSMLDNSFVVFGCGISDGDAHNHDNLPTLLAGKGGGSFQTGRHIVYTDGTPLNNLYLAMLDRFGIPVETLGDSTGELNPLF